MFEHGIIIVGGGHGGSQLAASLRSEGYDGPLTLVTAENDIPYQRPPLSKAFLKEMAHDLLPLRPESFYDKNAIRLLLAAEVESIDLAGGTLRLADGAVLSFDGLALATGARARLPKVEGAHLAGVHVLRVVAEARALRDRLHAAEDVVVVGGGFIGLEVAATARLLGKRVTVLEAADRLMGRVVAPQISAHFLDLHRGWGSDVKLATPLGRIIGEHGRVVAVETVGGERIPADLALIGIGVEPNVEIAATAGLALDNGIARRRDDGDSGETRGRGRRLRLLSAPPARPPHPSRIGGERGRPGQDRGQDPARPPGAVQRGAVVLVGPG